MAALVAAATCVAAAAGQDPAELQQRLDAQDARIRELEQQLQTPAAQDAARPDVGFEFLYDGGYVLRSTDPTDPFRLRINGRMQFRYSGFKADQEVYNNLGTAASGEPILVQDRNDWEIERGRLAFTGTWLDPDLHFFINFDADTDDAHIGIFHDFWFNYEFCDEFDLYAGKGQIPGSRDWIAGSTRTHFADRSMATSYFRPDRAVGLWAKGKLWDAVRYHAMVCNGFVAADLEAAELDTAMTYAASVWWDPNDDVPKQEFGKGYADIEDHEELGMQFGTSVTYSPVNGLDDAGFVRPETNFLGISDGTRLNDLGVAEVDLYLLAVDAAFKYHGLSVNSEWFYRWLQNLAPRGPLPGMFPLPSVEDWGFYADVGYMAVEKCLEPVVRVSLVDGDFKESWEYAVGVNWYINGTHENKLTADVSFLDGSPVRNSGPNYRVGDDGVMVRVQWQIAF